MRSTRIKEQFLAENGCSIYCTVTIRKTLKGLQSLQVVIQKLQVHSSVIQISMCVVLWSPCTLLFQLAGGQCRVQSLSWTYTQGFEIIEATTLTLTSVNGKPFAFSRTRTSNPATSESLLRNSAHPRIRINQAFSGVEIRKTISKFYPVRYKDFDDKLYKFAWLNRERY